MKFRRFSSLLLFSAGILLVLVGIFISKNTKQPLLEADNGEIAATTPITEPLFIPLANSIEERNAFMEAYAGSSDKFHLRSLYEEYLPTIGANGLIDSIHSVTPICHDEGHDLGKTIFANLQDVGSSLAVCHDACSSGCMHGVLMEFFSTGPNTTSEEDHLSLETVTSQMNAFCESEAIQDQYLPGDCAHGIGHTLMYLADYKIQTAVEACDLFSSYPMRYYCATGAYMEYNSNNQEQDAAEESLFYPCDTSPYPAACFRYKLVGVFRQHYLEKGLFSQIRNQCLILEDNNTQLGCFHGIGNAHMPYVASGEIKIDQVCGSGTDDQQYACIDGIMERLGKYYPWLVEPRCQILKDGWKKDLCLAAGQRKMYDLTKSFDLYAR